MKKIVYISDFFVEEIAGGAEIYDDILVNLLRNDGYNVIKFKNAELSDKHIKLYRLCGYHFIVSNFTLMSDPVSIELVKHPDSYSIMEHDHKYIKTRNPAEYPNFIAPKTQIINYDFYKNALAVFCQSDFHSQIVKANLELDNIVSLGGNLWSDDVLFLLKE